MNRSIHKLVLLFSFLIFSCSIWAASGPTSSDDKIGAYAAILGTNRLAKDPNDKTGLLLIKLAAQIKPENDLLLLTQAYMEKNKAIDSVKTKLTEPVFCKLLSKRATTLIETLAKNSKQGPLALVYLQTAELLYPASKSTVFKITKLVSLGFLEELGFTSDLEKNLAVGLDFPKLFEDPEPMVVMKPLKLSKSEIKIFKAALGLGTKRLNKEWSDSKGLTLIRLAGFLKPHDSQYLLSVGLMLRGQKLDPLKLSMTETQLLELMLTRAASIAKSKSQLRKQEALLFYKIVLLFNPESKKALLGEIKLKKKGLESSLEDLLNMSMSSVDTAGAPKISKSLKAFCPSYLGKFKSNLNRGITGILHGNSDNSFSLYINGKKRLSSENPRKEIKLKPGDIITVKAEDFGSPFGFASVFSKDEKRLFSTLSSTWYEYEPKKPEKWWITKGMTRDDLSPAFTGTNQFLKDEKLEGCLESIWGKGGSKSTAYLIYVVQYEDLMPNTMKWISQKATYKASSQYQGPPLASLLSFEDNIADYSFHTDEEDQPNILIDLGKVMALSRIEIQNRWFPKNESRKVRNRSKELTVWAASKEKGVYKELWNSPHGKIYYQVDLPKPVKARFIKIGLKHRNFFHLKHVKILALP
ncbi:MAG: discoidin domain-containing protein [Lentisphaeria bacterium]|nr:discoidin domain-containing protein [Lentisphaeria bacterium]NQZ70276.1 discoidin domain-containing protein [Lentisphaeria bacterium]